MLLRKLDKNLASLVHPTSGGLCRGASAFKVCVHDLQGLGRRRQRRKFLVFTSVDQEIRI